MHHTNRTGLLAAALSVLISSHTIAGPLDPPAGPIDSTMKTLDQVEPRIPLSSDTAPGDDDSFYKISQSGSYYFTQDIRLLSFGDAQHGIEITASNVTLDLSGYALVSFSGTLDAIRLGPGVENVKIVSGTITGFTNGAGVDADTNDATGVTVRDMRIENGRDGIVLNEHARIDGCVISDHSRWGISTGSRARISDNQITGCGSAGIFNVSGMDANIIEDNMLSGNNYGFFVDGLRNVIVRNFVSDSTTANWDCNSGNHLLVINATDSTFAVGDSGGSSFGSSNPNANYSH